MDVSMSTCAKCGEELEAWNLSAPCLECGSGAVTVNGGFRNQTLTLNDRGVAMIYGSIFAWQEQWANVLDLLKEIERYYQPGNFPGDRTVRRSVRYFYLECFHVGDWLWEDKGTTLTKDDVAPFVLADPALSICEAMANTSKHHTRSNPKWMSAWVHSVTHNQELDVADAVIEWKKGATGGTIDALDLARQCYMAWRGFQKSRGLKTLLPL
jgi:hypothetical protein